MNEPPSTSASEVGASFWQWVKRPHWSMAAPILLIAFTGVFAWQIFLSQSEVDQGLAELSAAYREARPMESRLSGFSYAPYTKGVTKFNENKFKQAEGLLNAQAEKLKSPSAFYALGKLHLARQQFADALQQFEVALKSDPNNAALRNDLGVALMEQVWSARGATHPVDLSESRKHLEQAIQLDHTALEPLFNLALLQHRQGLWEQAEEQWNLYMKNDVRSKWAEEAKRYLGEIQEKKKGKPKG